MRQSYSIALMRKLSPLDQIRTFDPLSMIPMHAIGLPGLDTPIHYCSRIKVSVLVCISDDMKFIFLQRTFFTIVAENGWNFIQTSILWEMFFPKTGRSRLMTFPHRAMAERDTEWSFNILSLDGYSRETIPLYLTDCSFFEDWSHLPNNTSFGSALYHRTVQGMMYDPRIHCLKWATGITFHQRP